MTIHHIPLEFDLDSNEMRQIIIQFVISEIASLKHPIGFSILRGGMVYQELRLKRTARLFEVVIVREYVTLISW
jgi:hypothetical protein